MTGKRTRSFKCAVHHRDREVCSENDFHILVQEPPVFRRWVNEWLSDRLSCLCLPAFSGYCEGFFGIPHGGRSAKYGTLVFCRHVRRRRVALITSWRYSNLPWAGVQVFFFCSFAKWRKATVIFVCLSVRLFASNSSSPTRQISIKFGIWVFLKIWGGGRLSFLKILQERRTFHVKTYVHVWSYLTELSLEWKMFQTDVVEKIKTRVLCSVTSFFPPKIVTFMR